MESPEVIEINEEPPSFNEDKWIGKGRQYPKGDDAPSALAALQYYIVYIDSLLTIYTRHCEGQIHSKLQSLH